MMPTIAGHLLEHVSATLHMTVESSYAYQYASVMHLSQVE